MKTRTIVILLIFFIIVNAGLGITIYFIMNPGAKLPVLNMSIVEVPKLKVPEIEIPKIEVTEEDVNAVKENMKTKVYERAQLTEEDSSEPTERGKTVKNEYVVEAWGLTFHLPKNLANYNITIKQDLLTIERHLQVLAYVVRYDAGEVPTIDGQWEVLSTYKGSDYYVRKGTSVVTEEFDKDLDAERDDLYDTILRTYHFMEQ